MAKIEFYTCDFCGTKVGNLSDLQSLTLQMDSEVVHQQYEYHVCPWCAGAFIKTNSKDLFLEHLRTKFTNIDD